MPLLRYHIGNRVCFRQRKQRERCCFVLGFPEVCGSEQVTVCALESVGKAFESVSLDFFRLEVRYLCNPGELRVQDFSDRLQTLIDPGVKANY